MTRRIPSALGGVGRCGERRRRDRRAAAQRHPSAPGRTRPSSRAAWSRRARRSCPPRRRRGAGGRRRRVALHPFAERHVALPLGADAGGGARAASTRRRSTTAAGARSPCPSNWEMEGFGYPVFRNVHQPFPATPPFPPADDNPVGSYRRTFTLPDSWRGRRVLLHFEAVKSAFTLWVNGREVGYNEGGFEPAEFDVTPYLRPGENLAGRPGAALLRRHLPRMPGHVAAGGHLPQRPPAEHARRSTSATSPSSTDLDAAYRDAELAGHRRGPQLGRRRRRRTLGARSPVRRRAASPSSSRRSVAVRAASRPARRAPCRARRGAVANPRKWTAETPNLYTLTLELVDAAGRRDRGRLRRASASAKVEVRDRPSSSTAWP